LWTIKLSGSPEVKGYLMAGGLSLKWGRLGGAKTLTRNSLEKLGRVTILEKRKACSGGKKPESRAGEQISSFEI
jgi:hypothetical protein